MHRLSSRSLAAKFILLMTLTATVAYAQVNPVPRQNPNTQQQQQQQNQNQNQNQNQQSAPKQPPAELMGSVHAADTGAPLKKATLTLRGQDASNRRPITTTTDVQGNFHFQGIDPGRYRLQCARNGYVSQEYEQKSSGQPGAMITLKASQSLNDITFRLTPGGAIAGRVTDEDSEPVINASVSALLYRFNMGERQMMSVGNATTNDRGEYRIFGLDPGKYYVRVDKRGNFGGGGRGNLAVVFNGNGQDSSAEGTDGYPSYYYPSTIESSQAVELPVIGGSDTNADVQIVPRKMYTVSGVVMEAGALTRQAQVSLVPRGSTTEGFGDQHTSMVGNNGQGAFNISGVLPGPYTLYAASFGFDFGGGELRNDQQVREANMKYARTDIDVGENNLTGITVTLAPGHDVSGRVRVGSGVTVPTTAMSVIVQTMHRGIMFAGLTGSRINDDYTFTLKNMIDDEYAFTFNGIPGTSYVKSAQCGGRDLLTGPLHPGCGTIDVDVEPLNNLISGHMQDNSAAPLVGVSIVLVPETQSRYVAGQVRTTTTDQSGDFTMRSVRPGSYIAFALNSVEANSIQDPAYIKKFIDQGKSVRVSDNGTVTVEVKMVQVDEK